jgi:hypothetical protein
VRNFGCLFTTTSFMRNWFGHSRLWCIEEGMSTACLVHDQNSKLITRRVSVCQSCTNCSERFCRRSFWIEAGHINRPVKVIDDQRISPNYAHSSM